MRESKAKLSERRGSSANSAPENAEAEEVEGRVDDVRAQAHIRRALLLKKLSLWEARY